MNDFIAQDLYELRILRREKEMCTQIEELSRQQGIIPGNTPSTAVRREEYEVEHVRAAKVRRDTLERRLRELERELIGEARRKVIEARLWLLEGEG